MARNPLVSFARALASTGLLASALACSGEAHEPAPRADADAWWDAVAHLDLAGARALNGHGDRGAFLDALDAALEGGSEAAEGALCALASGASEPRLRRRAGQAALNLLRIEARWEAMAGFGERCGLALREGAVPAALLELPVETVELPDEPVVLPLLEREVPLPFVAASARGPKGAQGLVALLDTGAGACMLASEVAERLGVEPLGADAIPILGSVGRGATARPGSLPELRLGALRVTDLPVLIADEGVLEALLPGVSFVVGWELLQRVAVEIGGAAREIVLRASAPRPDDVPPNLVLLHEPVVRLESEGTSLLFLLDTGAAATDATPGLVARLHLTDLARVRDETRGLGATRDAVVPEIRSLDVTLGGVTLGLGNVSVWEMPDEPNRMLALDGTLGADVALAGRLVIDGPARRVTLAAH